MALAFSGLVKDIYTGSTSSSIGNLTAADSLIYFSASDAAGGNELWRSDGTSSGTYRVADIRPGTSSSSPADFFYRNGTLYFSATDGTGRTLWKTDGTTIGTTKVLSSVGAAIPGPMKPVALGDTLYVDADDGIWRSDGTPAGTFNTGLAGSNLAVVGSHLYFARLNNFKYELCKSDGTIAGTSVVYWSWQSWTAMPSNLTEVDNYLFFDVTTYITGGGQQTAVYCCNGTSAYCVQDFASLARSVTTDTHIYFVGTGQTNVYDNIYGVRAASDTANSAKRLVYTYGSIAQFGFANNKIYFTGNVGLQANRNFELWYYDIALGTNTSLNVDGSDSSDSYPQSLTSFLDQVVFSAADSTGDRELWISDGTVAGTRRLVNANLTGSSAPTLPFAVGSRLFFVASDGTTGRELWTYIDNQSPADIGLSAGSTPENVAVGTAIGTLSTIDPDGSGTFTYSLVPGVDSADNAAFSIVGNQLSTAALLDCEARASYLIRVRSTDQGGLYTEKSFVITVTNVNEAPTDFSLSSSTVAENSAIGTVVGALSSTDVDAGDTFTYTLVSGVGSTDNAAFSIVDGKLTTAASFNYETKNSYSARIRSTDAGGLFAEKTFTISVVDINEAPTGLALSGTTGSLAENTAASSRIKVADILVTDDALGTNMLMLSGTDAASFEIDGTTLYLKAATSLDSEARSTYEVSVNVDDSSVTGSSPLTVSYTLTVTNVNEAPTDFSLSSSTVAENSAIGTVVGALSSTDVDAGDTFTYTLVSGVGSTDNAAFSIVDGKLTTAASFNYETKNSYSARIRSTDAGGLFAEKTFTISVVDINEAPTGLALSGTTGSLAENTATSSRIKVADILVTDDALGTNMLMLSGTDAASFEIDGTTLYLKAATSLDSEARSTYEVSVNVDDSLVTGSSPLTVSYTLTVTNVNEAPTDFSLSSSTVAENSAIGTVVGTLSSTDVDVGDTFTYTLVSGVGSTDNAAFSIVDGKLSTAALLDCEARASYLIRVRSTDQGGLYTEKSFVITVTNVNEAPTDFSLSSSTVAENSAIGTVVGTLSSTDVDAGDTFTYTLVSGVGSTDNAAFSIVDGKLTTAASFNYETKNSYSARIRSADAGGLFTEKAFTIFVTDVAEPLRIEQLIHAAPGAYKAGQQLTWQIVCTQNVTVVGRPTIPLRIGTKQAFATYAGGTGTNRLVFTYRVANTDNAAIVSVGRAIALGSTSRLFAGNTRLPLAVPGGAAVASGVRIDTTAPKSVGRLVVPAARIYARSQILEFRARFSEPVYVAVMPWISIRIGATTKAAYYVTGSGSTELVFRYTVAAGDATPIGTGITVGNAIVGGVITDAAANLASRTLSVPTTTNIRVDGGPLSR